MIEIHLMPAIFLKKKSKKQKAKFTSILYKHIDFLISFLEVLKTTSDSLKKLEIVFNRKFFKIVWLAGI